MTRLYRLLLRLYPREIRDEFGDEMTAVFSAVAHDGGGLWFLLRECSGLVHGAARERPVSPVWLSAMGGIVIALVTHWLLYSLFGGLLSGVGINNELRRSSLQSDQLELALMALAALLFIVPMVVVACQQLQRALDAARLRHHR
jgi:hypothetical protein